MTRCSHRVHTGSRFDRIMGRACSRSVIEGSSLCAIHSPEATAKREAAAFERHDAEVRTRRNNLRRIEEQQRRAAAYPALLDALEAIAKLGGNLPDDALISRTGPNDAVARGLMYTGARSIALDALGAMIRQEQARG